MPLEPGWALLLYTDGLIEGRVPEPGERLWEEGLLELLAQERDTDLERLPARLVERARSSTAARWSTTWPSCCCPPTPRRRPPTPPRPSACGRRVD